MPNVKQDGIKYHFLSLWYDSTWDWTPVSRAIGEDSTHYILPLIFFITFKFQPDKIMYWSKEILM